jgi:CRISPR system Cascade subunit CasC
MVADVSDINVDAAAQVAHAISVHPVDNEYDYFTAVDDRKEAVDETGAGMIGTVEFNSATLYRYATVDVDRLRDNLGDPLAVRRALEAFLRAFATSMPTGKQNTFANRTLPDAIVVILRDTQPVNLVGAFEEPVLDGLTTGRVRMAADRLAEYAADVERAYGARPVRSWVVRVGDRTKAVASLGEEVTMDELITAVGDQAADRMANRP